jgi:hypothetical protein
VSGDRHAGVPRCLHPREQREYIHGNAAISAATVERCLVCRAVRCKRVLRGGRGQVSFKLAWGPWVSAGDQVRGALKRMNEQQAPNEGSFGLWTAVKESNDEHE